MCLAKAYMAKNLEESVAEDITSLKNSDGKLVINTLFGEQKEIKADVREIDFKASRIILEKR